MTRQMSGVYSSPEDRQATILERLLFAKDQLEKQIFDWEGNIILPASSILGDNWAALLSSKKNRVTQDFFSKISPLKTGGLSLNGDASTRLAVQLGKGFINAHKNFIDFYEKNEAVLTVHDSEKGAFFPVDCLLESLTNLLYQKIIKPLLKRRIFRK